MFSLLEIYIHLQIEPPLRRNAENDRKAHCYRERYAAATVDDHIVVGTRDTQRICKLFLRETKLLSKFFENTAWCSQQLVAFPEMRKAVP
jgi:hypothetical protein